jgi:Ca2+-binding EF-hand superfamily protein
MKFLVAVTFIALSAAVPAFAELPGADLLASLLITQFDRDHDGNIDGNEWETGINDGFVELDHDRDGSISESEIDALVETLGDDIGRLGATAVVALIKKMLFTFDTNGDRNISKTEYDEGCSAIFKLLDTNHDGLLSKAELAELPARLLLRPEKK